MAQKPKKQIKHDNLDAQITVMKEELGVVNKELGEKLTEKDSLTNECVSRLEELSKVNTELEDKKAWVLEQKRKFRQKNNDLIERENNIERNELTSKKKIGVEQKLHKEETLNLRIEKDQLDNIIFLKEDNLAILTSKLKDLKEIEDNLSKNLKEKVRENLLLESEIAFNKDKIGKDIINYDKQLERKEKKLIEIETKILENQQLIEEPTRNLKESNRRLNLKKKNLDVMIMRFNKTFKKHYPNQELKL